MAQAPCRLRRPPRVLMNTASASRAPAPVLGGHPGPARRATSQALEGRPGRPAQRDEPLLGPLAEHPEEAVVPLEVGQGQADHLGDPGPGPVEQLEERPVAQVGRPGAADRIEQGQHLVLVEGLGQPPGQAGRAQVGGGVGRRSSPPRPGTGTARGVRWWTGPSTPGSGPGCATRPDGARWPRCRPRAGRRRPAGPTPPRRRCRGGRRRGCSATCPSRRPATTGTPRRRSERRLGPAPARAVTVRAQAPTGQAHPEDGGRVDDGPVVHQVVEPARAAPRRPA